MGGQSVRQKATKNTGQRATAAALVADDELTDEEISQRVGVHRATLHRWRADPVFQAMVAAHVEAVRAGIRAQGIANVQNRIDALNDRWQRMQRVIEARAERGAADEQAPAEAQTGLLVRQVKLVKVLTAVDARVQEEVEWTVDGTLLAELRATEKQAAQELGQWTDKAVVGGGLSIVWRGASPDDV